MKRGIKKMMVVVCAVSCLTCSVAYGAQSVLQERGPATHSSTAADRIHTNIPVAHGTMRAPEALIVTCAKLSKAIQRDKQQLRSVLRYMHDYGCSSEPAASSSQCVNLQTKKEALEARISANQAKAREKNCT